jgi:lipopolysaccharide/colanic/teichoic acid biosynthesis glycosyltransferase
MYKNIIKRLLDFLISFILLIVIAPILVLVSLVLCVANKGNPFFYQIRPGKNEKLFKIVKFKTMTDEKDKNGQLLPDEKRLTSVGKWVRKTSLDELPQLINVVKGEMSLIGPRPLLPEYLPLYNAEQRKRHLVKPGITGWAQVNGRNAINWQQKFDYDIFYVKHISIILDFKIILLTIKKVFLREGISSNTSVTMEKFKGN